MQIDTAKLSDASREFINRATRDWLLMEAGDIARTCPISKLFNGRYKTRPIIQLRARLRAHLRETLRCKRPQHGSMLYKRLRHIVCLATQRGWGSLSDLACSTFVGLDHSTLVKQRRKDEQVEAKAKAEGGGVAVLLGCQT